MNQSKRILPTPLEDATNSMLLAIAFLEKARKQYNVDDVIFRIEGLMQVKAEKTLAALNQKVELLTALSRIVGINIQKGNSNVLRSKNTQ